MTVLRLDAATNDDSTVTALTGNVRLRPFCASDLEAAQALSAELHWPHRLEDWRFALAHGTGVVAERDGRVVGTALRWLWGTDRATLGLVIVSPALQGHGIGRRLMTALLQDTGRRNVLLHATAEAQALYERLGFRSVGEIRQHQGIAAKAPWPALAEGERLRPPDRYDRDLLAALDVKAAGLPRPVGGTPAAERRAGRRVRSQRPGGGLLGAAPLRTRPCDRPGGRSGRRVCSRADLSLVPPVRRQVPAHRRRCGERLAGVAGKSRAAARRQGDRHGARQAAAARPRVWRLGADHAGDGVSARERPPKLDRLDLRILCQLQKNGRITNVDLADAVGLSPSPCLVRLKRLEQAGYVAGYGAHIRLKAGRHAGGLHRGDARGPWP